MFIAMNRFRVKRGAEEAFEKVWLSRDSYLDRVPGFVEFHLLKGPEAEDHTLYSSHTVWQSKQAFEAWTKSEEFRASHARVTRRLGRSIWSIRGLKASKYVKPSLERRLPPSPRIEHILDYRISRAATPMVKFVTAISGTGNARTTTVCAFTPEELCEASEPAAVVRNWNGHARHSGLSSSPFRNSGYNNDQPAVATSSQRRRKLGYQRFSKRA